MYTVTKEQLARLEKVAKKAATNASHALSKIIGAPVVLDMLSVRATEVGELAAMLASPDAQMAAVILPVAGQEGGSSALITSLGESRRLVEMLRKRSVAVGEPLDASAISALKECGNIIGGAFLSALSNTIGISLVQSVPVYIANTLQEVVAATVAKLSAKDRTQSVAFEIDFSLRATTTTTTTTTEVIVAHYLFILELAVAQKLLEALEK